MTDIIRTIEAELSRLRDRIQMLEQDRIRLLRSNEELRMELDHDASFKEAERLRVDLEAAQEKILGAPERCFLAEIEKIREAEPLLPMRELFALWKEHNAKVRAEERRKEVANAGGEALRSWLADWVLGGFKEDKGLCGCGEWDCPDRSRVYVRGRGFVDRYKLELEREREEAEAPSPAPVAQLVREEAAVPVAQKRSWAQVAAGWK